MAVKTITIDIEAYELLARYKKPGQSFSQVIKEHFGTIRTGNDLDTALQEVSFSEGTIDAIEAQVRGRRRHRARSPKL